MGRLEGFGRAQELGNDPEVIRPSYFSSSTIYEDMEEEVNKTNAILASIDLESDIVQKENIPNYDEYIELLVQTKMEHPELFEEYLRKVLEKVNDSSATEESIRREVETRVQLADLKSNLGKIFG